MNMQRLKSTLSTGGAHLGDLIFWTLADARIDRGTLERLWVDAGLGLDLLPDPPTAEKAIKLAVREAQVGQRERLLRLGKEDDEEVVFCVVHERRDDAGNVTFNQEARIRLDRQRELLTSDHDSHDMVCAVRTAFQVFKTTHTPDDVRRGIVKAIGTWAAVTLRESGGVYFIASPFAENLRRLQTAIEKVGASRLHLLPVHDSPDAARSLGEIAKGSIEAELAALQTEISAFVASPPDRASTLLRRFDAFEALRGRARLYRSVLNIQVQDLDQQLNQMSATVEGLVNAKAA